MSTRDKKAPPPPPPPPPPRPSRRVPRSAPPNPTPTPVQGERRRNQPLREALDELLSHTRDIARRAKTMTPAELDYAQQRLEWLADEVWRVGTGEATPPE